MKTFTFVLTGITMMALTTFAEDAPEMDTTAKKASYAMGFDLGESLLKQGIDIDAELYVKGIFEGLTGKKSPLEKSVAQKAVMEFRTEMQAKLKARAEKEGIVNKAEAVKFLSENKKKAGVLELPSGLQYKIIKQGDGAEPKITDTVTVHYTGKLLNGDVFDSSHDRGQPATFPLRGVIKGWQEGLQLMKAGASYKFFIPPELAYGPRGSPPRIGSNSALVFDVDLISVK